MYVNEVGWLSPLVGREKGMFHVNPMCFHSNYIEQREVVKNQIRTHMSVLNVVKPSSTYCIHRERKRERKRLSIYPSVFV